jgi:thiol-disulfide isomerase/thioredoxin
MPTMKRTMIVMILSAMAASVWLSCSSSDSKNNRNQASTKQTPAAQKVSREPGQPVLARYSAYDVDGNSRQLSEWIGRQPVVINFWGTWCPPCRREIPGLIRLYDEYKSRGVEIVSLAIERYAGPQQVKQFAQQAGMEWVQLMANEDVGQVFQLTGAVPTTIFFDASGREVARHIGARPYEAFKPDFEKIAAGS